MRSARHQSAHTVVLPKRAHLLSPLSCVQSDLPAAPSSSLAAGSGSQGCQLPSREAHAQRRVMAPGGDGMDLALLFQLTLPLTIDFTIAAQLGIRLGIQSRLPELQLPISAEHRQPTSEHTHEC